MEDPGSIISNRPKEARPIGRPLGSSFAPHLQARRKCIEAVQCFHRGIRCGDMRLTMVRRQALNRGGRGVRSPSQSFFESTEFPCGPTTAADPLSDSRDPLSAIHAAYRLRASHPEPSNSAVRKP